MHVLRIRIFFVPFRFACPITLFTSVLGGKRAVESLTMVMKRNDTKFVLKSQNDSAVGRS